MEERLRRSVVRAVVASATAVGCAMPRPPAAEARAGAELYLQACRGCHGAEGKGAPPNCPPLAGHAADLLAAPGGRAHLIRVPLFGLTGPIEARGAAFSGAMPPFGHRSDAELAAILDHVAHAWGNERLSGDLRPFTADEVAAERARRLTPQAVHEGRPALRAGRPGEMRP